MKLTAKVKVCCSTEDAAILRRTLEVANECCEWLSTKAWTLKKFRIYDFSGELYHSARAKFPISAQMTMRCISKVCDSYAMEKTKVHKFGIHGSIAFDDKLLSWRPSDMTVSIWTLEGRRRIPFQAGPKQLEMLKSRQGESDLLYHRGKFYLAAVCNVETPALAQVDEFLGIDLGIAQIASDSDGGSYSGGTIKGLRHRHRKIRTRLQSKQTRSATRRLRRLAGKERRFATDVNHCISKQIVAKAKGSGRGIAIENLKGIRGRITARRQQRATLHSWAFYQLRMFLAYKALLAGIPLVLVDPRNSSRECSECGHIAKENRPSQSEFRCLACGFTANADFNAACVIAGRALIGRPDATRSLELRA